MSTIIDLPQVGESVTEGIIGKWLKQPGDHVDKFEPLVEVMTDKVNMEVPSPVAGTLLRTLAAEGDVVPMGSPIAEMEEAGVAAGEREDAPAEHFEFVGSVRSVGPTGSGEGGEGRPDALSDEDAPSQTAERVPDERPPLSPLVRRLVAEHSLDPAQVRGTGRGGRVTRDDVLRHLAQRAEPVSSPAPDDDASVRALTPMRKSIAEHMSRSAREAPAAWSMVEVDVSGMVRLRAAHREAFERSTGVPLTYLPFCAHAVAQALSDDPLLNGRWDGDHVTLNHRVRLGIAVSTEQGLVVPVVHDADRLSVEGLAVRIAELAKAARAGALTLADVQGGRSRSTTPARWVRSRPCQSSTTRRPRS